MEDLSTTIINLLSKEFKVNGNVNKLESFLNILKPTNCLDLGLIIKTKDEIIEVPKGYAIKAQLLDDELWFDDNEEDDDFVVIDDNTVSICVEISDIKTIKTFI